MTFQNTDIDTVREALQPEADTFSFEELLNVATAQAQSDQMVGAPELETLGELGAVAPVEDVPFIDTPFSGTTIDRGAFADAADVFWWQEVDWFTPG